MKIRLAITELCVAGSGRHRSRGMRSVFVWFTATLLLLAALAESRAEKPALEVIRQDYLRSVGRLRNMECRLLIERMPLRRDPISGFAPAETLDVSWLQQGRQFSALVFKTSDRRVWPSMSWRAFDGELHMEWSSGPGPTGREFPRQGSLFRHKNAPSPFLNPWNLLGVVIDVGESLEELLARSGAPVVEDAGGIAPPSIKVQLPSIWVEGKLDRYQVFRWVWFDQEHGSLPRRMDWSSEGGTSNGVLEMSDFEDLSEAAGEPIWIPTRAVRSNAWERITISASAIVLEPVVPPGAFSPEFPAATQVIDRRPGPRTDFVPSHGGRTRIALRNDPVAYEYPPPAQKRAQRWIVVAIAGMLVARILWRIILRGRQRPAASDSRR